MIYDGKGWSKPPGNWNVPTDQLHYVGKLKNGMYFLTVGGFYVFNGNKFVNLSDSVNENADFRILKGASVAGTATNIQAGDKLYIRLRNRGLVIFDGTHLNFYTKKDGLPSANLHNPVVDTKENLFFNFPSGSLRVQGDKFQTYYDDESVVTGGPYGSIMDGNGNLVEYYNGIGLYINKTENSSYPLKISSVIVDKQYYYYDYPEELSYSQNSFVFNYAALNYRDPRQTTFEHFLEGFDKEWSRPSNLPFVEYQNLPTGKYKFRVRAITSNGIKTNEESFSFVINPPWWLTWWAYGIYIIGFVGMLGGIRKYELERRKENENKKFLQIENDRKTKELDEARQLQLSMLPKALPNLPHLDIAVFMKTATEVGGDYYDFHVHMDGTLTVILGDATGHGMMSGMMVSIMKSLFMSDRTNKELKPFFENANEAIKDMQLGRLMMALTCVQISNNKIITTNAGMPPLFIYRKKSQTIEEVVINNMPLGSMKGIVYDIKEIKIERGDTLLLMSDGFAELKNVNNEIYGYKRARNSFEESAKKEPEEIITHLRAEARSWTNDKDPDDDVTFVVIKVK
jgi:serine phosphatase RsbU (regulator of sigma subunit)